MGWTKDPGQNRSSVMFYLGNSETFKAITRESLMTLGGKSYVT